MATTNKKARKKITAKTTTDTRTTTENIALTDITVGEDVQQRTGISEGTVKKYAELIEDGHKFPPLILYRVGDDLILADGVHRLKAYQSADKKTALCEVRRGSLEDAILHAATANGRHGLPMTNADKRKAVLTVLRLKGDDKDWSDHRIAAEVGVSQPFVSKLRDAKDTSRKPRPDNGYQSEISDDHKAQVVKALTECVEFASGGGDPQKLQDALRKVLDMLTKSLKAAREAAAKLPILDLSQNVAAQRSTTVSDVVKDTGPIPKFAGPGRRSRADQPA